MHRPGHHKGPYGSTSSSHHPTSHCCNTRLLVMIVFFAVGILSSLGLLAVSTRALFHGDWLKYGGIALWTTIHAGFVVFAFVFIVLPPWIMQKMQKRTDATSIAYTHVTINCFVIALMSLMVAIVIGQSYMAVDDSSRAAFNQNFPENFYKFTGENVNSTLAAYSKWLSVYLMTFFYAILHIYFSLQIGSRV